MARLFTADPHYFHKNIIKYCNRPFHDVPHMNHIMIERHNKVVGKDDDIYFLGDVAFCSKHLLKEVLSQLNGKKHLIRGNHDELNPQEYIEIGFESVAPIMTLKLEEVGAVCLAHDPSHSIMVREVPWLVGHLHDMFKQFGNCINVGVDVWDFYPVSEAQIVDKIKHWKKFGPSVESSVFNMHFKR